MKLFLGLLFLLRVGSVQADTIQIPHGGIYDHSDSSVSNSIAWCFEQYGEGYVYELTSDMRYYIGSPLELPDGATLTDSGVAAKVRAGAGMDNQTMILMGNYSTVKDITVDANRIAICGLDGQYKTGVTVDNCWVINTKNDFYYETNNKITSHLVNILGATNAVITGCSIKNAGCNPIENWDDWGAATNNYANGISASRAMNVLINNCVIDQTLGGSIAIARTEGVIIQDCELSNSARINLENNRNGSQDSIIGYHNYGTKMRNAVIRNNTITSYYNHGIHISGERLILENNTIHDGWLNAIRLDDHRVPTDYVIDAWVEGNVLSLGSAPGVPDRLVIDHYQAGTASIETNYCYEDGLPLTSGFGVLTSNVYSRYETFDNGTMDDWTVNSGAWSVDDRTILQSMTSSTRTITWNNVQITNGSVQVYLHQDSGSGWSGIHFRKTNASDGPYDSGYMAFIRDNGNVTLFKAGIGALETVSSGMDPQDLFFLRLTVELNGSDIQVYLNGRLLIEQTDTTYFSGYIGLATLGPVVRFDSVGLQQ